MKKNRKESIKTLIGFSIFTMIALLLCMIIFNPYPETLKNFEGLKDVNDYLTSILFLFIFLFALFIYATNRGVIKVQNAMRVINRMPDFLPFKHSLENHFKQLIKKKSKIIVLIRTLDEKNYKWVLNQIAAYNSIMNDPHSKLKENLDIEFLFVNKYSSEIDTLIDNLHTDQFNYILITSLSAIFKESIIAREKLNEEQKTSIQILGSLSSINDKSIQKIIDNDEQIIRIFPPDYDEAKTAMQFIFSKIKNAICANGACKFHDKTNNIIILHNGTYGRAVRDRCEHFFKDEFQALNINTVPELSPKDLSNKITFYSFDYKSDERFLYDQMEGEELPSMVSQWQNANNYFYIIGYEPNVSIILENLDEALTAHPQISFSLLFSGTASMKAWRETIYDTIHASKNLKKSLPEHSYYMQLHTLKGIPNIKSSQQFNLKIKHYSHPPQSTIVNIVEELHHIFPKKHISEINNILDSFLSSENNENNYISIFTIDSIKIAEHAIRSGDTLLQSKFKVLRTHERKTDILVNGDSINQYSIKILE